MVRSITTESLGRQDVGDGLVVGLEVTGTPHGVLHEQLPRGASGVEGFVEGRGLRGLAVASIITELMVWMRGSASL